MKNMMKVNTAFSVTFIVLVILSYVDQYFDLHIPMYKWMYSLTPVERLMFNIHSVLVPIVYLFVLLPMMKKQEKNER